VRKLRDLRWGETGRFHSTPFGSPVPNCVVAPVAKGQRRGTLAWQHMRRHGAPAAAQSPDGAARRDGACWLVGLCMLTPWTRARRSAHAHAMDEVRAVATNLH